MAKKKRKRSDPNTTHLRQVKFHFQESVVERLSRYVGEIKARDRRYSMSIFAERAVLRELDRLEKNGELPEHERTRSSIA